MVGKRAEEPKRFKGIRSGVSREGKRLQVQSGEAKRDEYGAEAVIYERGRAKSRCEVEVLFNCSPSLLACSGA